MKLPYVIKDRRIQANFDFLAKSTPLKRAVIPVATPVGFVELGGFDGENITGIRITANVRTSSTGGDTFFFLRPNSITSLTGQTIWHRHFWDTVSTGHDVVGGANSAGGLPGLPIAYTNWAVSANGVMFQGVFYPSCFSGTGFYRHYQGMFNNRDYQSNDDRHLIGSIESVWKDTTTVVNSIGIGINSGAFTGRIVTEIIS